MSLWNRHPTPVLLTLLIIETDPLLRCPQRYSAQHLNPLVTPKITELVPEHSGHGSTPNAGGPAAHASTPTTTSFENDANTRLIDATEATWGLTMGSPAIPDIQIQNSSPLFSGYLLKRMGLRDDDGLLTCGIDLIYAQRPCEALLKEVLEMYGRLATLARIRGIVHPVKSVLPLHVAAAIKAHAALGATLRWIDD